MDKTGWPPGLLQDECKGLSRWLSTRLGARYEITNTADKPLALPQAGVYHLGMTENTKTAESRKWRADQRALGRIPKLVWVDRLDWPEVKAVIDRANRRRARAVLSHGEK